jgi:hypothetical protein
MPFFPLTAQKDDVMADRHKMSAKKIREKEEKSKSQEKRQKKENRQDRRDRRQDD